MKLTPSVFTALSLSLLGASAGRCAPDPAASVPSPLYTVVPLLSLPGVETEETSSSDPRALNNKGECVGEAGVHGRFQAVRWDAEGHIHLLSTPSQQLKGAQGINDSGQIITSAPGDSLAARLFIVDATGMHLIAPPPGTQTMGFIGGEAINNAGQVAFNTQTKNFRPERAFVTDHGTATDLGHLPLRDFEARFASVHVRALSPSGMAAGVSQVTPEPPDSYPYHAFLWRQGVMTDLGVLPGYDGGSSANALNDAGDVVGTMSRKTENEAKPDIGAVRVHGFLWHDGKLIDIGGLPGCQYTEPTGINSAGQIVGNSYNIKMYSDGAYSLTGGSLSSGVFLWENGKMQDLQTLVPKGWRLNTAVAINDRGDILCTGYHDGMPSRALGNGSFLLRRIEPLRTAGTGKAKL